MEVQKSKAGSSNTKKRNGENEEQKDVKTFLPGYKTIEEFTQTGFKALMEGIRCSNNLPNGKVWDYYTSFTSFKRIMDDEGERVLNLMSKILRYQGIRGSILRRDLEEKFDLVIEANDTVLERVGCNLDELSGVRRNPEPLELVEAVTPTISGSWNKIHLTSAANSTVLPISPQINNMVRDAAPMPVPIAKPVRLLTARNIQRPQLKFKDKVDNSYNPFEPRIKEKPNSLKPLAIFPELSENGDESFSHPYEFELDHFKVPTAHLKRVEPQKYKPLNKTPLIMIEHAEQLPALLMDLTKYTEIAVDLEHHSYRTFQGITCLMQISTWDTDYIIDTLELRNKLHCLNEVFTKPTIVKVFHGADHDIEWLQRDLSLYVVNMFDTHQAAKALNFAHLSLAFLLKHYCNIIADKHFQLADWRIRPLPEELLMYARQDTHYMLYIYHMMRNELLDAANGNSNILLSVIQCSTEICKKKYEKPALKDDSHMQLYRRNKKLFDNRQLYALKELYHWRDKFARQEDESTGYVLPNHMLLQMAEVLPREMQGILACCNPVPPMVRKNLLTLHQIILKAREEPLVKTVFAEETRVRTVGKQFDLEGALHCPHDLTHTEDFRDDLPTLLGKSMQLNKTVRKCIKKKPIISVFEDTSLQVDSEEEDDLNDLSVNEERLSRVTFFSPYERYKEERQNAKLRQQRERVEQANEDADNNIEEQDSNILGHTEQVIEKHEKHELNKSVEAESENEHHIQRIKQHFMEVSARLQLTKEPEVQENIHSPQQIPEEEMEREQEPLKNQVPKKRKRNKKKTKLQQDVKKQKLGAHEDSYYPPKTEFQKFDYSKVDFSNFKGGSKVSQNNSNQLQEKFKSKGKRNRMKKKNQSMTFKKDH